MTNDLTGSQAIQSGISNPGFGWRQPTRRFAMPFGFGNPGQGTSGGLQTGNNPLTGGQPPGVGFPPIPNPNNNQLTGGEPPLPPMTDGPGNTVQIEGGQPIPLNPPIQGTPGAGTSGGLMTPGSTVGGLTGTPPMGNEQSGQYQAALGMWNDPAFQAKLAGWQQQYPGAQMPQAPSPTGFGWRG